MNGTSTNSVLPEGNIWDYLCDSYEIPAKDAQPKSEHEYPSARPKSGVMPPNNLPIYF